MKRREFLHNMAWVTGGLLLYSPAKALGEKKKISGRVRAAGRGVRGVVISDGYSVVTTNGSGKYELEPHPEAKAVFMSTPSGYAFVQEKNIARHYHQLKPGKRKQDFDFNLVPLDRNDSEHRFIIWADPQVRNANDVEKMMAQSVPDVQQLVSATAAGTLMHGITVGDIAWDDLKLFNDYDKAVEKMGIPFFQCLGNHDMDYNKGGDETSDDTFQQQYGPTYYSFNRGEVHYVVMDDVRYLGKDRLYDGHMSQEQLNWLQKDLSFVPKEKLIILCVHIPVHNGVKNNLDLYAVLKDRKVHIMSGHTHYNQNVVIGNIYEHNHGTVCGAWWTGPICGDGTPSGYGVYDVKGTELSWHYKSAGESSDHQYRVFVSEPEGDRRNVLVNIWNHDAAWKTQYWVDGKEGGSLEQIEAFDPHAYATLLGPDLPKPRGFAEPKKTEHMFRALVPSSAREIRLAVTDPFGKTYSSVQKLQG